MHCDGGDKVTLHSFALLQFITVTAAFLSVAILKPEWLRTIGGILCRLSDAMIAARECFHQSEPPKRTTPARARVTVQVIPIPTDPIYEDVRSALVNLGTSPTLAGTATRKALINPTARDFETVFKSALQLAARTA